MERDMRETLKYETLTKWKIASDPEKMAISKF
jgi:hypothetical protein